MGDHRTLEEFLGEDSADDPVAGDNPVAGDDPESPDESLSNDTNPDDSELISTYRWTPDGAACEECGVTVRRRWRDADALVCADCKDW